MLDPALIRPHFPALARTVAGQPVIYADNPGGTQVPRMVPEAMADYLLHRNANTHGAFVTSHLTDETITAARLAMADLINAPSPDEIVFGPNMTTLTFGLSRAIGQLLQPGDEIVVTVLDHDANITPWTSLRERGVVIRQVDIHPEDVTLDRESLAAQLSPRTRLVALGHASNAVGTINPLAQVIPMIRSVAPDAMIFVDAVQSVPHLPVNVQVMGCDFLVASSYKFFGPHLGILWGRYALLDSLPAYKVRPADETPPGKFETGTKNHEGLAGLIAAINYLDSLAPPGSPTDSDSTFSRRSRLHAAMQSIQRYEQELSRHLIRGLSAMPGVRLYGINDLDRVQQRVPTVAISVEGKTPWQLAEGLAAQGIFAWHGNYYALGLMERLGLEPNGALRLGLVHYNTVVEIDRLLEVLDELRR
jgi:cysteine desulfurase family protein (TIGR01976 family)